MYKTLFLFVAVLVVSLNGYAQAKKPTIMVVPSDNWCINNGYYYEFDNLGRRQKIPDYRSALQESSDLLLVISKINELFAERGFPLKDLESSLKQLENQAAEDAMISSKTGAQTNESPIDKLKYIAKADIWIQITWNINSSGSRYSMTYNMQGLDAYSTKQIAGSSGTGPESGFAPLQLMLVQAVKDHFDIFVNQLQSHFEDLERQGREIVLRIVTFSSFNGDLENEYRGKELSEIIEDWVYQHTKEHRFNLTDATENMMLFEQVRINLYDIDLKPLDARAWARDLQKMLKDEFQIVSKLMTRGLGQAQVVIGDK